MRAMENAGTLNASGLEVHFVESWHDHPLLIQALAEKVRAGLAALEADVDGEIPVILTAHSVPESTIAAGDPYDAQVKQTATLVAAAARLRHWRTAYQSQGMSAEPWIGPTVESQLDELAAQGYPAVLIGPIGFLCDHAEILYDIDVQFRGYAQARGHGAAPLRVPER